MAIKFRDVVCTYDGKPLSEWTHVDESGYFSAPNPEDRKVVVSKNASDPALLSGHELDALGEMWKMHRCTDETDIQFRARVERTITGNPLENIEVTISVNLEDEPMKKLGPHMYDETCHCDNCTGWRAKRDAGMHIDIETVKREAGLIKNRAEYLYLNDSCRHPCDDPLMQIPCSVVLALCEKADKDKPAVHAGGTNSGETKRLRAENKQLRAELDTAMEWKKTSIDGEVIAPIGQFGFITNDKRGQPVAQMAFTDNCPTCGAQRMHMTGDLIKPNCPYCLAA